MNKAIITGINGQDGSYLAELLLNKGYKVYGFIRRESLEDISKLDNIKHILDKITLIPISITDSLAIYKTISQILPNEFYHLAAHSFVTYDMNDEINIMNVNFNSTLYIANTIKEVCPDCKLFFAGSSEMFGNPETCPQDEKTKFNPKSMYGISKVASYYLLKNLRERFNIFITTGIMYNHESPRRGNQFVTKKIISNAVKIKYGLQSKLELGNLDAKRDWGYAPDYVNAMWLIVQQKKPDDYIIATGRLHKVRDFVKIVFKKLQLDYKKFVVVDPKYYRPGEKIPLCGNPYKIENIGWKRTKNLEQIIDEMLEHEILSLQGKLKNEKNFNLHL